MRILELCLSESLGGLELYFHKTCKKFNKPHYLLSVVKKNSRLERLAKEESNRHVALPSSNKVFQFFLLRKLIATEKIDVVHVHHKNDLLLCAITLLFSKRNFKLAHTRHMDIPRSKKDPYHRFIYQKIDLFITITKQQQKSAIKYLPIREEKIKLLYYGVSIPPIGHNPFASIDRQTFKIGVFSRIEYKKGHKTLLESINLLKRQKIPLLVHIYGDVMDQSYFEDLKRYIAENDLNVHFKGFHKDPAAIMGYYDCIVVPSSNETFGLVAVEAMLANTAVVAANHGGLMEIIEHERTGLLFDNQNAENLAVQLERLILDPIYCSQLAKNGQESAKERFNEKEHYHKLAELMKQLLIE